MERQAHIHMLCATERTDAACAAACRYFPGISKVVIFGNIEDYTNTRSDTGEVKAHKTAVRESVTRTRVQAGMLGLASAIVYITPPVFETAVTQVTKIVKEQPSAVLTFDLYGGSAELCIVLFQLSVWLEADAYYADFGRNGTAEFRQFPVPRPESANLRTNRNYGRILSLLSKSPENKDPTHRVLPRSYLFTQLETFYCPVRKKGVKDDGNPAKKTDLSTGKKAVIPKLSQGTFSRILATMEAADLIRQVSVPGSRRERSYRITPAGELALRLLDARPQNPKRHVHA